MLTYKINTSNIKRESRQIFPNEDIWEKDGLLRIEYENHHLKVGDEIAFYRNDGSQISFSASTSVAKVEDENVFYVNGFGDVNITVNNLGRFVRKVNPKGYSYTFLAFFSDGGGFSNFMSNRDDVVIKELLYGDGRGESEGKKRCDGDDVLYEDWFLYDAYVDAGFYDIPATADCRNVTGRTIYLLPNDEIRSYMENSTDGVGYVGNTWEYIDGKFYIYGCILPVNTEGRDNTDMLLWLEEDKKLSDILIKSAPYLAFYAKDERFIEFYDETSGNGIRCGLKPGVEIFKIDYSIKLDNAIAQDYAIDLYQDEAIQNDLVNRYKKEKNPIIDYEKQCFSPAVFNSNAKQQNIDEITFNLHFRKRKSELVTDEYGTILGIKYGEWQTNDDLFWNNYTVKDGGYFLSKVYENLTPDDADLIGYLGFDDDDVYYQKRKLSNSFLRLSFFDTQDRRTQKLLFTSTIFVDVGKLYSHYVENVKFGVEKDGHEEFPNEYVYTETARKRLAMSFSCRNKYDSEKSSEGFYLYLFPDIFTEERLRMSSGSDMIKIYMKVEFNHAKYGYTIPMVCQSPGIGFQAISPEDSDFRINYSKTVSGSAYADLETLFNDMYIPIKLKKINGEYLWQPMTYDNLENGTMTINLYEPKINKGSGNK